jgi:hypothetical protein
MPGFTKDAVSTYFDLLKQLMEKHKFLGDRKYNYDKTGLSTVQIRRKVVADKGSKKFEE